MRTFFTSDAHINHKNIIFYCNRPFKDVEHMNKEIIRRHNERVKPEDTVIYLGDFCFRNSPGGKEGEGGLEKSAYWSEKLNGNFVFVRGNHDKNNSTKTIIEGLLIKFNNEFIYCVHNPEHYNKNYKINLVGHVHEKWRIMKVEDTYLINVGVDVWNFYPITLDEIWSTYIKFKRNENNGK